MSSLNCLTRSRVTICLLSLDLVAPKVGEDERIDKMLVQLCEEVSKECSYMTELMEIQVC